jgi:hypothetical protein
MSSKGNQIFPNRELPSVPSITDFRHFSGLTFPPQSIREGGRFMATNVLGKVDEHAAESIHKVSRTTTAVADAIEAGIDTAKRLGKHGSDAAEELMDDAVLRIKRHPVETLVAAFAVGFAIGGLIDRLIRRS